MINSSKVVIPAQARKQSLMFTIQSTCNYIKILGSHFHGNDKKEGFATFDEIINDGTSCGQLIVAVDRYGNQACLNEILNRYLEKQVYSVKNYGQRTVNV